MNIQQDISKICKDLMFTEPYYGLFLSGINKNITTAIPTLAVRKKNFSFELLVNPDFWNNLNSKQKLSLIKHEVLHVVFFHLFMMDLYPNKELFNVAADLVVNQYCKDLPEGAILLENFDISMERFKGLDYYYNILKSSDSEMLKQIMDQMKGMNGKFFITDAGWSEFSDADEIEKHVLENNIKTYIKEIANQTNLSRGTIPSEVEIIIESFQKKAPTINWRQHLRRFIGNSKKTFIRTTIRKESKRFPDDQGLKVKRRQHILVAIDTSGSVSEDNFKEFFEELVHINNTGVEITVLQCDASIKSIKPFRKSDSYEISGRGGTDFDVVIEYLNEHRRKFDSMVYFTDGECTVAQKPTRPVLWLIASDRQLKTNLPGKTIQISNKDEK